MAVNCTNNNGKCIFAVKKTTMEKAIKEQLLKLYRKYTNKEATNILPLPRSGSSRQYFRLQGDISMIGVFNEDKRENEAFLYFANHFKNHKLAVPEIFISDLNNHIYLQEDLGDATLFSFIETDNKEGSFSERLKSWYKQVLTELPKFQVKAAQGIDYDICYPRRSFDRQSMLWDLNYFKYYFLKLGGIQFDEEKLENDFNTFMDFLEQAPSDYFLYRDFQSRNIMIKDNRPFFIDFQGGRKGALQYDIASLLYDAKANIPHNLREEFLEFYLDKLEQQMQNVDRKKFKQFYYGFVLIRIMQAMGAYGYRGFFEGKKHFLQSIPFAIANLSWVLDHQEIPVKIPELDYALRAITHSQKLMNISKGKKDLVVEINSFSFKRGIPVDTSGHGGGFVFDCRALPNPGRHQAYKTLTGSDDEVINFLIEKPEVHKFLDHTWALVRQSVENYLERGFEHLTINFGCTGGQHRSVYSANYMAKRLQQEFDVQVQLRHREQE